MDSNKFEADFSEASLMERFKNVKKTLKRISTEENPESKQVAEALAKEGLVSLDFVSSGGQIYPVALGVFLSNDGEYTIIKPSSLQSEYMKEMAQKPSLKEIHKWLMVKVEANDPDAFSFNSDRWAYDSNSTNGEDGSGIFWRTNLVVGESVSREQAEAVLSVISDDKEIIPYQPY